MVFDGEEYHTYPYIPNRTIVVSAAWDHYGDHPNSFTGKLRATIGFMYCLNSKLDAMCEKYPLKLVNSTPIINSIGCLNYIMLSTKLRLRLEFIAERIAKGEPVELPDMIWADKLAKANGSAGEILRRARRRAQF